MTYFTLLTHFTPLYPIKTRCSMLIIGVIKSHPNVWFVLRSNSMVCATGFGIDLLKKVTQRLVIWAVSRLAHDLCQKKSIGG